LSPVPSMTPEATGQSVGDALGAVRLGCTPAPNGGIQGVCRESVMENGQDCWLAGFGGLERRRGLVDSITASLERSRWPGKAEVCAAAKQECSELAAHGPPDYQSSCSRAATEARGKDYHPT